MTERKKEEEKKENKRKKLISWKEFLKSSTDLLGVCLKNNNLWCNTKTRNHRSVHFTGSVRFMLPSPVGRKGSLFNLDDLFWHRLFAHFSGPHFSDGRTLPQSKCDLYSDLFGEDDRTTGLGATSYLPLTRPFLCLFYSHFAFWL